MFKKIVFLTLLASLTCVALGCSDGDASSSSVADGVGAFDPDADPRAQLLAATKRPDLLERARSVTALLEDWPMAEVDAIQSLLEDKQLSLSEMDQALLVTGWAKLAPQSAVEWAMRRPDENFRWFASRAAAYQWGREDHEGFVAAVDVVDVGENYGGVVKGLVDGWYASGGEGLGEFIAELGRGKARERAADVWIRRRIEDGDAEAVREWAKTQLRADAELRRIVYGRVGRELARIDPAQAVSWCEEVCRGAQGEHVMPLIAREWAKHSGADALDWLLTQPDEIETWSAIYAAFRLFVKDDGRAALDWVEGFDEERLRTDALQGPVGMAVSSYAWSNTEKALVWADYLTNDEERELALITIARRWRIDDPEAADAWLDQSELTEAQRAFARTLPPNTPAARRAEQVARERLLREREAKAAGAGES